MGDFEKQPNLDDKKPIKDIESVKQTYLTSDKLSSIENGGKIKACIKSGQVVGMVAMTSKGIRVINFKKYTKFYQKSDAPKTDAQKYMSSNNNLFLCYDIAIYSENKDEFFESILDKILQENPEMDEYEAKNIAEREAKIKAAAKAYRTFKWDNVIAFMCAGVVADCREINDIMNRFGEEAYNSLTPNMLRFLNSKNDSAKESAEELPNDQDSLNEIAAIIKRNKSLLEIKKLIGKIVSEEIKKFKGRL